MQKSVAVLPELLDYGYKTFAYPLGILTSIIELHLLVSLFVQLAIPWLRLCNLKNIATNLHPDVYTFS